MSPNANFQNEARRDMTASSVADVDDDLLARDPEGASRSLERISQIF